MSTVILRMRVWKAWHAIKMKLACRRRKAAFVTGVGGYVGRKLCCELLRNGYSVTAFDLTFPDKETPGITKIRGDIRDSVLLQNAVEQSRANVVFHLASYGMSGREQLNKKKIEQVNIQGTKNLLDVCVLCGVEALVYTSTFNVVFGGQEIVEGKEDELSYFPLDKHVDHYSRTKAIAEQAVLAANGSLLTQKGAREKGFEKEKRTLKTCALRCAGIYGEGEERHLPRIVRYFELGLFQFTYGSKDSKVEFLHGDNFVQAHIRAAESMQEYNSPVPGEAYFISDGKPINNFEFFRPLCEGLGHSYPSLRLPLFLIYYMAFLIEIIHSVIGRYIYNFQPFLTRAEVFKTGVTHYFSLDKAHSHFGYSPQSRDLSGVIQWFKNRKQQKHTSFAMRVTCYCLIMIIVTLLLMIIKLLLFNNYFI